MCDLEEDWDETSIEDLEEWGLMLAGKKLTHSNKSDCHHILIVILNHEIQLLKMFQLKLDIFDYLDEVFI